MKNGYPKTKAKSEFTDYTVAGDGEGTVRAAVLKLTYAAQRADIELQRSLRRMCRATVPDALNHTAQSDARCGYPTKRERDEDIPSKRHVPHSKFLKQFKIVGKLSYVLGEAVYSAKVYILHATRGWKFYA